MPRTLALAGKYQSLILTALVLVSLERIEEVKAKYPKVSYADLYQLAGVVPVEVTGGPTMDFVPGRKDSLESPVEGCLPDAEQDDKEKERSVGHLWCWQGKRKQQRRREKGNGKEKGNNRREKTELLRGESKDLLKLPTDKALVEDPNFRKYVELYAKDEDAFFADYATSYKKLRARLHFQESSFHIGQGSYRNCYCLNRCDLGLLT
ncbi:hypothetical protein JHK85_002051 [Glycine max]|nr:hypothetical protein JHK85_002051 [Glycine max]